MKCNCKRFAIAAIIVFVFVFFYEWLFHGVGMAQMYADTASLWRPEAEMEARFVWLLAAQGLFSVMVTYIFTKGYENRGMIEGLRFGLIIGLLMTAPQLMMYAVAPYPVMMVVYWILGGMIELLAIGVLLSLIYRPATN